MSSGLNKDGGISFSNKRNFEVKEKKPEMFSRKPPKDGEKVEVDQEFKEPIRVDKQQLLRQERLGKKLKKAKQVQAGGLAINGGSVFGLLFAIDSFVFNPSTLESLQLFNDLFGLSIDFENIITVIQEHKAQLIGFCISVQTLIMGYKDTCQKMKDRDTEDFMGVINDELEKIGI